MIVEPVGTEPVKLTISINGDSERGAPAALPVPCTPCKYDNGRERQQDEPEPTDGTGHTPFGMYELQYQLIG